jgi:transposase
MSNPTLSFWTHLLQLPDYEVVHCQEESDLRCYRMTVVPRHRLGICPHCGKSSDTVHRTYARAPIKDLSISNYTVELKVHVLQFDCPRCGHAFTPAVPFLAEGAHATERFLQHAAELIRSSDIANAARLVGVPERTLANWYYHYLQRRPEVNAPKLKPVRHLGIDELALKKNTSNMPP